MKLFEALKAERHIDDILEQDQRKALSKARGC